MAYDFPRQWWRDPAQALLLPPLIAALVGVPREIAHMTDAAWILFEWIRPKHNGSEDVIPSLA